MDDVLKRAIEFARLAHNGQMRRGGVEPYIRHSLRTMSRLWESGYGCELDVLVVAVLHDVVEDTSYGFEDCYQFIKAEEGKEALRLVTKMEGESSAEALDRLIQSGNRIALLVKASDALDNSYMDEDGRKFTSEVLGLDPDAETAKYVKKAQACLDVLGLSVVALPEPGV